MNFVEPKFSGSHLPHISVIMPAYNGEQYIAQSIESVLSQTVGDLELIIVDDGSADRTPEIIAELQSSDQRIRCFRQANAGQAGARNKGIAESRGELIAFLDQDDLWLDHKLETQIKALEQSGADVAYSDGHIFGTEMPEEDMSFPIVFGRFSGAQMFQLLYSQNQIPMPTAVVRTEALRSGGLLNEDRRYQHADDYDLWLRLAAGGRSFVGLADKLIRYRIHSDQASTDTVRMLKAELAVLMHHENNPLLSAEIKLARFRTQYQKLVLALAEEGRYREAKASLKEILVQAKYPPGLLAQATLLALLPSHYKGILDLAHRARESVAYRVTRPLRRLVDSTMNRSCY